MYVAYIVVLSFMVFDILTGVLQAIYNKALTSSAMRDGLFKKCGTLCILVLGYGLQMGGIYVGFDVPPELIHTVNVYIIVMECISILENIGRINKDLVPQFLREIIEKLKGG